MSNVINYVSIAQLPAANFASVAEAKKSLIEIEKFVSKEGDTATYTSTKSELGPFSETMFSCGLSDLIRDKWGLADGLNLNEISAYYNKLKNYVTVDNFGAHTTPGNFKVNGSSVASQKYVTDALTGDNKLSFKKDQGGYYSTFNSLENNSTTLVVSHLSVGAPTVDGEEHNRYIFKVSQHTSNVYVTERAGWFTCYGWLSEKETYAPRGAETDGQGRQDDSKRWVALEANFKDSFPRDDANYPFEKCWRIIQLQPFRPNNFCSYVSFSLPVTKGLSLRVSTGFDVNNNSGKYSMVAGSLTNHVPNAFVGGVYCYGN